MGDPPAGPGPEPQSGVRWDPRSPGTPRAPGYGREPSGLPPYGEPQFRHPHYGYPPREHPPAQGDGQRPHRAVPARLAVASLVLGLAGLLTCPALVAGVAAVVTGVLARRQVAASDGRLTGERMATAGIALGVAAVLLGTAAWLLLTGPPDAGVGVG